jgi:hypothetical protein
MIPVYAALAEITEFLTQNGFRYALIGGLAAACRGQPRTTNDVDLTLWAELGEERPILNAILSVFPARVPDAIEFALVNRVLLIKASNQVPIDIGLASYPFEDAMLQRATKFELTTGLSVLVLAAEDVVVSKAMSGRPIDWFDIEGLFDRLGKRLDYAAILSRLEEVGDLLDLNEALPHLERIRQQSNDVDDPV